MSSFPLHKLRVIKRRFVQELKDHSVAALKSLKKHKRGVLVFTGESKEEGVHGLGACT